MGGILGGSAPAPVAPPPILPPPVMPSANPDLMKKETRKKQAALRSRQGRQSTVLETAVETLGG